MGRKIESVEIKAGHLQLDYQFKSKGVYFFTLSNDIDYFEKGKIIVH